MKPTTEPQPATSRLHVAMILTTVTIVVVGATASISWAIWDGSKAVASALAGGVCWLGGLGACVWPPGEVSAAMSMARLLGGILLRAGLPLLVGIAVQISGGPLAQAGFLYYVLVFYLATLGVETYLVVPRTSSARPAGGRPDEASR